MRILITCARDDIASMLDEIEIAAGIFPHDLLSRARNLRWLQEWGASVDWLLRYPDAVNAGFVLTNASGLHAIPISEHIVGFMLNFARGFHDSERRRVRREWRSFPGPDGIFELAGKTVLLIGIGAIGVRTAELATALGMRVIGVRRNPKVAAPSVAAIYGPDQLLDLLPKADFVVVTLPLTRATQGIIGEAELRAMRPTAHIINIGRGATIQEKALIRALQEGWIAGAGLDVFTTEPLPADSPLWEMENVILTTHYSGSTPNYMERLLALFVDNLKRYRSGKPLRNIVDKKLGY